MYKTGDAIADNSIYYGVLLVVLGCVKCCASCFTNKAKTSKKKVLKLKRAKTFVLAVLRAFCITLWI